MKLNMSAPAWFPAQDGFAVKPSSPGYLRGIIKLTPCRKSALELVNGQTKVPFRGFPAINCATRRYFFLAGDLDSPYACIRAMHIP